MSFVVVLLEPQVLNNSILQLIITRNLLCLVQLLQCLIITMEGTQGSMPEYASHRPIAGVINGASLWQEIFQLKEDVQSVLIFAVSIRHDTLAQSLRVCFENDTVRNLKSVKRLEFLMDVLYMAMLYGNVRHIVERITCPNMIFGLNSLIKCRFEQFQDFRLIGIIVGQV